MNERREGSQSCPILVALGANLPSALGPPVTTLTAALTLLERAGLRVTARSRWYESPPWPPSDQPWYANGVVAVETALEPRALLARLHAIEAEFGRVRSVANAARPLDLDLIAYRDLVIEASDITVPHPRLEGRAFVLLPLADVAPGWRHPATGRSVAELIAGLPADHACRPMAG